MAGEEQCYSLVITSEAGDRKYGYCRRVQPEGAPICLPLAYCILTTHRASGFYFKVFFTLILFYYNSLFLVPCVKWWLLTL